MIFNCIVCSLAIILGDCKNLPFLQSVILLKFDKQVLASFVGSGSTGSSVTTLWCCVSLLGLPGASEAATGPWCCCLKAQRASSRPSFQGLHVRRESRAVGEGEELQARPCCAWALCCGVASASKSGHLLWPSATTSHCSHCLPRMLGARMARSPSLVLPVPSVLLGMRRAISLTAYGQQVSLLPFAGICAGVLVHWVWTWLPPVARLLVGKHRVWVSSC